MTVIEFFDKSPLENIASALLCDAERIFFIGDNKKKIDRSLDAYRRVLARRGRDVVMESRSVNRNNLESIIEALESIIADSDECVFDLTGGEDLYLVAIGVMMQRHPEIKCHRFNFKNSTVIDCDMDGEVLCTKPFDMLAEENVIIHGGEIVHADELHPVGTYDWDLTEEFCSDVEKIWNICRVDPKLWNVHASTLGSIDELFGDGSLFVSFSKQDAMDAFEKRRIRYTLASGIMKALEECGLIYDLVFGDEISFFYKNEDIKRCLTVSGQILELAVAARLKMLKDRDGSPLYHDVLVGAVIDWDGYDTEETVRTVNEIDVLAMKDAIPVFISCKNGNVEIDELYKLNTVASRFGSSYAKCVLVATGLENMGIRADYIRARSIDMGIRRIENVDEMSDESFDSALRTIWCN